MGWSKQRKIFEKGQIQIIHLKFILFFKRLEMEVETAVMKEKMKKSFEAIHQAQENYRLLYLTIISSLVFLMQLMIH